MNALNGPVAKTRHAERTAIATALAQHLPRVAEVVAILPRDLRHVAKMVRLGLAETERDGRFDFVFPGFLDAMRHDLFASVAQVNLLACPVSMPIQIRRKSTREIIGRFRTV